MNSWNPLMHAGLQERYGGTWHVSRTYCGMSAHHARIGGLVTCLVCLWSQVLP